MKKVVRLTESDLIRIVKRVISETETNNSADNSSPIIKMLRDEIEGLSSDTIEKANNCAKAVFMIKTPQVYAKVLKGLEEKTIMGYVGSDLSTNGAFDNKPTPWKGTLEKMAAYLGKFNQEETNPKLVWNDWSFGDKTL